MKLILSNDWSPIETALALLDQGLWPTAVGAPGRPRHPIGDVWWRRRPTEEELRDLFAEHPDAGGTDRLKVTHPDRLKVTHLGLQDGHPGQGW